MSNEDEPKINITQSATGSKNVTQIGVAKGDIHIDQSDHSTHIEGGIHGSNVNIASTLTNVNQNIGAIPNADDTVKESLKQLFEQLKRELEKVPPAQAEEAEAVAGIARQMVEQVGSAKCNKTMLKITGDSLKAAAENLAAVVPAVVGIAVQIVKTILSLGG